MQRVHHSKMGEGWTEAADQYLFWLSPANNEPGYRDIIPGTNRDAGGDLADEACRKRSLARRARQAS